MAGLKVKIDIPDNWIDIVIEKIKQDGDFVLVTRCKDCKYFIEYPDGNSGECYEGIDDTLSCNDYCSRAERKEAE